jgi:nucleotide-binding universal stress UspA family protein
MNALAISPPVPAVQVKRILYATDFSDASRMALPLISTIARKYGSQVFITNIFPPIPYSMGPPEVLATMENKQRNEAQAKAQDLSNSAELAGLQAAVIVQPGDAVEEIDRIVHDQKIDLVVLSTHGRTGWKHLLMGSVAEELFRKLTRPVLTIGPCFTKVFSEKSRIKTILFPTDLSKESRIVFPYLASLASENKSELILIHVLPEEAGTNPDARVLAEPLRKEMETVFTPHISALCRAEFVIDFGNPAERILALADLRGVDLIGMGVRKAPEFITSHFRNTVAYRIVLGAECPVLTWRPPEKWFDWFMAQWQKPEAQ